MKPRQLLYLGLTAVSKVHFVQHQYFWLPLHQGIQVGISAGKWNMVKVKAISSETLLLL